MTGLPEYIGREVALMTAYEIISIFIGILALLISFGSLLVALLAFLDRDRKNRRKKIMPLLSEPQERRLSMKGK